MAQINRLKELTEKINGLRVMACNEIYATISKNAKITLYEVEQMQKEIKLYDKLLDLIEIKAKKLL